MPVDFELEKTCAGARAGKLRTDHGTVETPVFMPVGTQAAVKAASVEDLESMGYGLLLANAYHLYLRPGVDRVAAAGGIHDFMGWKGAVITDSGGYQVFSLSDLRNVTEEGIRFRSHIDGSLHLFTPRLVVEAQASLGSDIVMSFDYCTSYPCTLEEARKAVDLTLRWAKEGMEVYGNRFLSEGYERVLFGIVQGSIYEEERKRCAEALLDMDFPGYAVGGLSVGEPVEDTLRITEFTTDLLPEDRPRYLMGMGTPVDIVEGISRGIDMFDCVLPTRNARNGTVFTRTGKMVLKNALFAEDYSPLDTQCACRTCKRYTRAYLRHLFLAGEILGPILATYHSLHFYRQVAHEARNTIIEGTFLEWKEQFIDCYTRGESSRTDSME